MDATVEAIGKFLIDHGGFLGIACLVEGYAIWRLFNLYIVAMETRIEEARKSVEAMSQYASSLENLTDLIRAGRGGR